MSTLAERGLARKQAAESATIGDYARTAGASVLDLASAIPGLASYGASQIDSPFTRDIQYVSDLFAQGLSELGDDVRGANTPAAQRIMSATVGSEDFWNHKFDWFTLNAANTAAPIAAGIASAVFLGPGAGVLINQGIAGAQSAGMTYNDMVKDFDSQDLSSNSLFQSLLAKGLSEQEARREFKRLAIGAKPAVLFVITGMLARYGAAGQVISKLEPGVASVAAHGLARRVGTAVGEAGAEEATQNTAEEFAQQKARIDAGLQKDYDYSKLGQAAVAGGIIGGGLGVPGGVMRQRTAGALPLDEGEEAAPRVGEPGFIGPAEPYGPARLPRTGEPDFVGPGEPYGPARPLPPGGGADARLASLGLGPDAVATPPRSGARMAALGLDEVSPPTSGATTARPAPPPPPSGAGRGIDSRVAAMAPPGAPADIAAAIEASFRGVSLPPAGGPAPTPVPSPGAVPITEVLAAAPVPETTVPPAAPVPTGAAVPPISVPPISPTPAPGAVPPTVTPPATPVPAGAAVPPTTTPPATPVPPPNPQKTREDIAPTTGTRVEDNASLLTEPAEQPEVQAEAQGIVPPEPPLTSKVSPPEVPPVEPIPAPEGAATEAPQLESDVAAYRTALEDQGVRPDSVERATNLYRERRARELGAPVEAPAEEAPAEAPVEAPAPTKEAPAPVTKKPPAKKKGTGPKGEKAKAAGKKKPPAPAPSEWKEIGRNEDGTPLYEDQHGVRAHKERKATDYTVESKGKKRGVKFEVFTGAPEPEVKPAPPPETKKGAKGEALKKKHTLKGVNAELQKRGVLDEGDAIHKDKGKDFFYVEGPGTASWPRTIMEVRAVNDLSIDQWQARIEELRDEAAKGGKKNTRPGKLKLTPKAAELVTPKPKVGAKGARVLNRPGAKKKSPPQTRPMLDLRAVPRAPEPAPAPRTKGTPAARFGGEAFTGKTFEEAKDKLLAQYKEDAKPPDHQIDRGHIVDGKFHAELYAEGDAQKTRDIARANKKRVQQHVDAMEHQREKEEAAQEAYATGQPGETKNPLTNRRYNAMLERSKVVSKDIFDAHSSKAQEPLADGGIDIAKLERRLKAIVKDMADTEAEEKAKDGVFYFSGAATKARGGHHNLLVRARELNQLFIDHPGAVDPSYIERYLRQEAELRADPTSDPVLEDSRMEASNDWRKLYRQKELGLEGDVDVGSQEDQLADRDLTPEEVERLGETADERIGHSPAFQEEVRGKGRPPQAMGRIPGQHWRSSTSDKGRTVPVEGADAEQIIEAAREALIRNRKKPPPWMGVKVENLTKAQLAARKGWLTRKQNAEAKRRATLQEEERAKKAAPKPRIVTDEDVERQAAQVFHEEIGNTARAVRGRRIDAETQALAAKLKAADKAAAKVANTPAPPKAAAINMQVATATEDDPVRIKLHGENIDITHPRGSERNGVDSIAAHYGEFRDRRGVDGQRLDVYVGQNPDSPAVFVISQRTADGKFDENKVMLGFASEEDAVAAYKGSMPDTVGEPNIATQTVDEFKEWVKDPKKTGTGNDLTLEVEGQKTVEAVQRKSQGIWEKTYDTPTRTSRKVVKRLDSPTAAAEFVKEEAAAGGLKLKPDGDTKVEKTLGDAVFGATEAETTDETPTKGKAKGAAGAVTTDTITARPRIDKPSIGNLYSPFDPEKKITARALEKTDVKSMLNKIEFTDILKGVTGRRSALTFLRKRLNAVVGDMEVYTIHRNDFAKFMGKHYVGGNGYTQLGAFIHEPGAGTGEGYIVLNSDLFDQDGLLISEIKLHEAIHGATYAALQRSPRLRSYINSLMGEVMRHHGILDPKAHYGFTNAEEFVANGMTDPKFQEMLASTPLSKSMAAQLGIRYSGLLNAWHAFLNFVTKANKLPPGSLSVMHGLVHVTEDLMNMTTLAEARLGEAGPPAAFRRTITPREVGTRSLEDIRRYYAGAGRRESLGVPWLVKWAGLDKLARSADRFWGTKDNPVRKVYSLVTTIAEQTNRNLRAAEKLIASSVVAEKKAGTALWTRFAQLLNNETAFNVYADRPIEGQTHLGKDPVGNPTLKGVQALAKHAALSAEYESIIREAPYLATLRNDMHTFMRKRQKLMSHFLVHNMLVEGLRGIKDPKEITDELVDHIITKKLTDADKKFIGDDDLVRHISRAKELYNMAGPYFPLMRRGDWVVRATLKVEPPDASLNGTLKDGTDNVYEFRGDNARERAMDYAAAQEEKATVTGTVVDEKTGKAWEVLGDDSEEPGTRRRIRKGDVGAIQIFRTEVQNEHMDLFPTRDAAEQEAFELEKEPDVVSVKGVVPRRQSPGDRGVEFLSSDLTLLMRALEKRQGFKNMNPAMQSELRQAAQEYSLQMLGSTRVHKRRIMRRNVSGAALNPTLAVIDYAHSTASYTARLEFAQEMNEAMRELNDSVDAGSIGGAAGRGVIAEEVNKRIDTGNGFDPGHQWYSPAVQRLLTTSFIARLASPMYTMMNLLQVAMVSMPVVASRHGVAPTMRMFTKVYKEIGTASILAKGLKATYRKGVNPSSETETFLEDLKKRLKDPRERAIVDELITIRGGIEVSAIQRSQQKQGKVLGGIDTALTWAEGVSRQLPTAAEVVNRAVVLISAYRLELAKNGGDHVAARRYADDTNNRTNFNYSEVNAPRMFNHPLLRIPFQFKRFGHGMYQLLGEEMGRAWHNAEPGDRAEALKSISYIMATHVLMAGALGLPTEPIKAIVLGLFAAGVTGFNWQDVENAERELAADLLGPDVGEVVTRGITRALPFGLAFDISQRVGMADLFLAREPVSGQADDNWHWLTDMMVGAPGSMLLDFSKGIGKLSEGDIPAAAQYMTPVKGLRDLIRAVDTGIYGKKTASGRPTLDPYSFSEMFIRALGATPEREAESQELKAQFYSQQAYITAQRGKLEQQWAAASTSERIRMRGAIERFNRGKPTEAQLDTRKLNAYAKRQKTEIGKMQSGVTPNKSNQFVLEDLQRTYNAPR